MNKTKTLKLAYLAVIFALTVVMAVTPYVGFIPIIPGVGVSLTLLLIPCAVAAIVLGKYYGLAAGAFFGAFSMLSAYTQPGSPMDMLFRYPQISVLPRIPVGLVMAFVYKYGKKLFKKEVPACIAGAVAGAVTNTALVTLSIWLTVTIAPKLGYAEALNAFAVFPINLALEIAALAVAVPPIALALKKIPQFRRWEREAVAPPKIKADESKTNCEAENDI
ncbi:MAG: ECF transporter S component [Clostridiales bacterium]|jgi:uncharacterized membrane protein|nr:ECF transporter S component [Clostridiales bacterium]